MRFFLLAVVVLLPPVLCFAQAGPVAITGGAVLNVGDRNVLEDAAVLLRRYLARGITTVIAVGGPLANYPLRDSMNRDDATATVFLSGPRISTCQNEG